MADLWNLITKNIIVRSLVLAVLVSALVGVLNFADTFLEFNILRDIKSTSLNHYYSSRKNVENNPDINVWTIFDDDIDLARWPWSWDKFAEMFDTMKLYDAKFGMLLEETFSEKGSITASIEEKKKHKEELSQYVEDPIAFFEQLQALRPDTNEVLKNSIVEYPHALLSHKFIVTDDQSNKEKLLKRSENQKKFFPEEKKQAIKASEKYSIPWGDPGALVQAFDMHPLHEILSEVTSDVGFHRIIPDEDGTIRRAPTVVYYDGRLYFSKGIVSAAHYLGCSIKDLEVVPGQHITFKGVPSKTGKGDLQIPIDEKGLMYINWTGPKQLNQFVNLPFSLVKNYIVHAKAKQIIREVDFDEDIDFILGELKPHFLETLKKTGFVKVDANDPPVRMANEMLFLEYLCLWLINTTVSNEMGMLEGVASIKEIFSDVELYEGLLSNFNMSMMYQSLLLNNKVVEMVERGDKDITFEKALKESGVKMNTVFANFLMLLFPESEEELPQEALVLENLIDAEILEEDESNNEEFDVTLFKINHVHLDEPSFRSKLKLLTGLSDEVVDKYHYMQLYQIRKITEDVMREGFRQTLLFAQNKKVEAVSPLYFPAAVILNQQGRKIDVSLYEIYKKAIFVGITATGLNALNPTPYDRRDMMAGMSPAVFNTITTERFITRFDIAEPILVTLYCLIVIFLTFKAPAILAFPAVVLLGVGHYYLTLNLFDKNGVIIGMVSPLMSIVFAYIAANAYSYWEQQQERKKIRGMFSAMVSPEVLKIMEEDPDKFNLQGEKVVASMFSSDVSGFTSISEGVTAQELALILNLYLTPMSNLVMTYGGYVEKYEGDAIKADFGMPMPDADHAWKACYSALFQQEELLVVQRMLQLKYGVMITARMGVNTGVVNAGNMGSVNKMQYCAIGEEVAMAEELEPSNKMWETWVAIGPETHRLAGDKIETRLLDVVIYDYVTIPVYEVLGWDRKAFLEYWKGKPIPKLTVECWEKIIPEKILAYLDYYEQRPMPENAFQTLMLNSFKALEEQCIEYVKTSDIINIDDVQKRFEKLQTDLASYNVKQDLGHLTEVDKTEMTRLEGNIGNAKAEWDKKLHKNLFQLKLNTHHVTQMSDKMERKVFDEFNTTIDTLEKNHNCYIKRNLFPDENDKFGSLFSNHLQEILSKPSWLADSAKLEELNKQVKGLETSIKAGMIKFIASANGVSEAYHEFVADHCMVSDDKHKTCEIFAEGRSLYLERKWDAAIEKFKAGLEIVPDDGPCQTFITRCEDFKKNPPAEDWNGDWTADW